eukprot:scaffold52861_cov74-Phaeocystis_antarctica.AAC.1
MFREHVAPSATANGKLEVYGAPPLSALPSEQLRLQLTSPGYCPPEQVIAEEMVEGGCWGGEGGDDGGDGGDGGDDGGDGGGGGDGGDGGGGGRKQSSHPARLVNPSVIHWIGVPSGTTPSGLVIGVSRATVPRAPHAPHSRRVHRTAKANDRHRCGWRRGRRRWLRRVKGALATCVSRVGADGDLNVIVFSRLSGDDELADDKPAQDRAVTGLGRAPLVLLVLGQDCPSLDSTPRSSYRREEVHVHLVDEVRPDDAKVVVVAACIAADAERDYERATLCGVTVLDVV